MKERELKLQYFGNVTDKQWMRMIAEITDDFASIACDYSATCDDDRYRVEWVNVIS